MSNAYPVFIPSKGRANSLKTAAMFDQRGVDFWVVVEPSQEAAYSAFKERLLVMPENNRGLVYARNWIKDYATAQGHARHWQFDDDVFQMNYLRSGYHVPMKASAALELAEEFVDRYTNIALASFNSRFFVPSTGAFAKHWPPFYLNSRCYTCFLMRNDIPNRWRGRYNEDTDMTLQVLADGWCTVLFNAFTIQTAATMTDKGGQTSIYVGDGRLRMSRELEQRWPGVVTTKRKFGRPQHHVRGLWTKFTTPLKRRSDIDWSALEQPDNGSLYSGK